MAQCRQDRYGGVHAGEQVGHGHAHFLRATTQIVPFAGHAHQAADALHGIVVTCPLAVRAGLAKAGHAAIHQFGVQAAQAGVVQAVTGHVANLEIFNKDVAMLDQFPDQGLAFGLCDVAGHRTLVAVGPQVIGGLGGVLALGVFQKGRPPGAGVVARAGALDLDDVGPQVGQGLGTPGARQNAGEVENADAVE